MKRLNMAEWNVIPKSSKRGTAKENTVVFYAYKYKSDTPNRGRLGISGDLVKGDRCTIESDGQGRLRIVFDPDGHSKLHKVGGSSGLKVVELRKNAAEMFPPESTEVEFTVEDDAIYIDTDQFYG